ncbi:hypothetical protein ACIOD2_06320 [Amycolatopsis sp. NPDC088138]|uniref:hypothetical protein n=1 Tax=Amycolatopsis sp. NPDC088138 TaxID=3363938 RepID=UPI0037F86D68
METVAVPRTVVSALRQASVAGTATQLIDRFRTTGRDEVARPPGDFGEVLAWLWRTDPQAAVIHIAELMKQLREHHPLAHVVTPPVGFGELLDGVHACLPADFAHADLLISSARNSLGDFYGG